MLSMGHSYFHPVIDQRETGYSYDRAGLDYHGQYSPVEDVSGHFFSFSPLGTHGITAAIGEITGSGITVPILRLGVRSTTGDSTVEVVEQLNRLVCEISPDDSFVTLFYARMDAERRTLEYVSAGHEPALFVRAGSQRVQRLERTGTVLGLTGRSRYRHRSVALEPGDALVAFSDGICESDVAEAARRYPDARARQLVAEILERSEAVGVDRTVIAIRFKAVEEKGWDLVRYVEAELAAA
jgi:sigma-B regulation protein RsbU (phosphoserine phosphatase)